LKIYSTNKSYVFDDFSFRQMRNVLDKFAISLEGCLSHENLITEINQRRQTEVELQAAREQLEMRVQERTSELVVLNQELWGEVLERKKTENSLLQLQSQYRALVENAPDIIMRFDRELRCLYANPAIKNITGTYANDIMGKFIYEIDFGEEAGAVFYKNLIRVIETGEEAKFESEAHFQGVKNYQTHLVPEYNNDLFVVSVLGMSRDITEHKLFEKEIARFDRLGLVGEMAASIGHEVRNPMTTVRGYLQLYQRRLSSKQDKETFNIMVEEIDRANGIITEFLSLARNKAVDLKYCNLNAIISVILPLVQADALHRGNNVHVEFGRIYDLYLDEKEIRQCVLNLVRNALEAMPDGGVVTIKTYVESKGVVLSIGDQGRGIDSYAFERLGTPFFTTKGNGTGLGLAVCYSIAARHKAKIDVTTGDGGTTVYIRFPVINKAVDPG
jgi:PAS domain S-box-containing protein